jgi:hypothetical protein
VKVARRLGNAQRQPTPDHSVCGRHSCEALFNGRTAGQAGNQCLVFNTLDDQPSAVEMRFLLPQE